MFIVELEKRYIYGDIMVAAMCVCVCRNKAWCVRYNAETEKVMFYIYANQPTKSTNQNERRHENAAYMAFTLCCSHYYAPQQRRMWQTQSNQTKRQKGKAQSRVRRELENMVYGVQN